MLITLINALNPHINVHILHTVQDKCKSEYLLTLTGLRISCSTINDREHTNSTLSFYSPSVDISIGINVLFQSNLHVRKSGELNDNVSILTDNSC